jgi:hypothetical protein
MQWFDATHLQEHQILLSFCNTILDRRAFPDASLGGEPGPTRQLLWFHWLHDQGASMGLFNERQLDVRRRVFNDYIEERKGRRTWDERNFGCTKIIMFGNACFIVTLVFQIQV